MVAPREYRYPAEQHRMPWIMLISGLAVALAALLLAVGMGWYWLLLLVLIAGIPAIVGSEQLKLTQRRFIIDDTGLLVARPKNIFRIHGELHIRHFPYETCETFLSFGHHVVSNRSPRSAVVIPKELESYDAFVDCIQARFQSVSEDAWQDETVNEWLVKGLDLRYGKRLESFPLTVAVAIFVGGFAVLYGGADSIRNMTEYFVLAVLGTLFGYATFRMGPRLILNRYSIVSTWFGRKTEFAYEEIVSARFESRLYGELLVIRSNDKTINVMPWLMEFEKLLHVLRIVAPDAWQKPTGGYAVSLRTTNPGIAGISYIGIGTIGLFGGLGLANALGEDSGIGASCGLGLVCVMLTGYFLWRYYHRPYAVEFGADSMSVRTRRCVREVSAVYIERIEHEYVRWEHKFKFQLKVPDTNLTITTNSLRGSGFALRDALRDIYPGLILDPMLANSPVFVERSSENAPSS